MSAEAVAGKRCNSPASEQQRQQPLTGVYNKNGEVVQGSLFVIPGNSEVAQQCRGHTQDSMFQEKLCVCAVYVCFCGGYVCVMCVYVVCVVCAVCCVGGMSVVCYMCVCMVRACVCVVYLCVYAVCAVCVCIRGICGGYVCVVCVCGWCMCVCAHMRARTYTEIPQEQLKLFPVLHVSILKFQSTNLVKI